MKTTYQKPEINIEKITMQQTVLLEMSGDTKAGSGTTVLGKDRGSRSDDNDNFDDLW